MEKEFVINISQEQANYLQKLGYEVDSKTFVIDRIFSNHASDVDASVIESVPFKYYMKEYEKAYAEYEMAKQTFESDFLKPIVKKETGMDNPQFNWSISDFSLLKCKVTVV